MKKIIKILASFFYLGYSPIAPGTVGSFGGVAVYFLVKDSPMIYTASILFLICVGFLVSGKAEEAFGVKDSRKIVIDDAIGSLVTFFLIPFKVIYLIIGFSLYRLFDIVKPYPIRRLEKLQGSFGIMLDDILAAVFSNLILQVLVKVAS